MTRCVGRCCGRPVPALNVKCHDANGANASRTPERSSSVKRAPCEKLAVPELSSTAARDALPTRDRHLSYDLLTGYIVFSLESNGPGGNDFRRLPQLRVAPLG